MLNHCHGRHLSNKICHMLITLSSITQDTPLTRPALPWDRGKPPRHHLLSIGLPPQRPLSLEPPQPTLHLIGHHRCLTCRVSCWWHTLTLTGVSLFQLAWLNFQRHTRKICWTCWWWSRLPRTSARFFVLTTRDEAYYHTHHIISETSNSAPTLVRRRIVRFVFTE